MRVSLDQPNLVPSAAHRHSVQFYDRDEFLCGVVADFLRDGLAAGEPAIVIATEDHRRAFCDRLRAHGVDVDRARTTGLLRLLDARETLGTFMRGGTPHGPSFFTQMGEVVRTSAALRPDAPLRAYGEMVDLLWRDGLPVAALELEELWNQLAREYVFNLLCAYAMGNFYRQADADSFAGICAAHTHVQPTERYASADGREIALLEQRARSLEQEVAQRKSIERALVTAQRELHDFLENAAEGLHRVGPDGTILWANPAELALLGYSREEYVGHNIKEFHVDEPIIDDMLRRLLLGETLRDAEARLRAKDGSIKRVLINSNGYFEDGTFCYTRCFTRDVTARKQAEEELRKASRAKDEFLAMLGHELRNPLSPILTALQLMQLQLGDVAAKERAVIERQVKHLARLVDDLLDISRITRGKVVLRRRPIELSHAVAKAIETVSPLLEQRKHQLKTAVAAEGLLVNGDEQRLAQVIANLLTNAAKYTEPEGRVEISAAREGAQVVLRVRDSGIGIAPDLLPHLFDMFVQGERGADRTQGGLGLGLAIVKNLVLLHDGGVEARSDGVGRGSEFTVRLPAWDAAAAAAVAETPKPSVTGARRILVVDDNQDGAEILVELLISAGHDARVAFDGPSALAIAMDFQPDVALLDIGLPIMDGYELARRLRGLPGLGAIKLVAVTGYGQRADRKRSRAAGFDDHLVKPVEFDDIKSALARLRARRAGTS